MAQSASLRSCRSILVHILHNCPVKPCIPRPVNAHLMFRHNPRHLLIRNAAKRRFEHRRQGNVLHRIVNDCQKIQHRLDFQRIKISRPRLCDRRNPLRRQHLDKFFRPSADASKQNHNIPVLRPTVSAKLLIPDRDPRSLSVISRIFPAIMRASSSLAV